LAGCKAAGPGCPEVYWNTPRTNGAENAAAGQQDRPKPKACEKCGLGLVWFTHFSNDPSVKAPDRTIDYIFMPRSLSLIEHHVRQHDTLRLSDHFPVVAVVKIP